MTAKDGPTRRVLRVLFAVAVHGPTSLRALTDECGFSRAAVWRALDVLRAEGWVRMRLGDNAYILCNDATNPLLKDASDYSGARDVSAMMLDIAQRFDVAAAFGGFGASGTFHVLESTDKADYAISGISLVSDPMALAAELTLDKVTLVKVLRQFATMCSPEDRRAIESGELAAALQAYRKTGFIWSENSNAFAFPSKRSAGFSMMIRGNSLTDEGSTVLQYCNNTYPGM